MLSSTRPREASKEDVVVPVDERDEKRLVMDRVEADLDRHLKLASFIDGLLKSSRPLELQ